MFRKASRVMSNLFTLLLVGVIGGLLWSRGTNQPLPVSFFHVLTGSMSPKIPEGSLVMVAPLKQVAQVGDVITFELAGETLTHRITQILTEGDNLSYVTKGDRNQVEDYRSVPEEAVRGRVVLSARYLGRFGEIIQTPRGLLALILTLFQLLLLLEISRLLAEIFSQKSKVV